MSTFLPWLESFNTKALQPRQKHFHKHGQGQCIFLKLSNGPNEPEYFVTLGWKGLQGTNTGLLGL